MKLEELLEKMDPYQDFQIRNSKTDEVYTDVTYMKGGSPNNLQMIQDHKNDLVHGVSAGISNEGNPYVAISLITV